MKIVDIHLRKNKEALKPHIANVTVLVDGERRTAEESSVSPEAAIRKALLAICANLTEDLMNTVTVKQTAIF